MRASIDSPSPCSPDVRAVLIEAMQHRFISCHFKQQQRSQRSAGVEPESLRGASCSRKRNELQSIRGKRNEDKGEAERVVVPPVACRPQDTVGRVTSRGAPPPQFPRRWCRWWPDADVTPLSSGIVNVGRTSSWALHAPPPPPSTPSLLRCGRATLPMGLIAPS
jgi:hypothetical protein